MKIQEIRYQNLNTLLQVSNGNQAELARKVGTNSAYINQIINKTLLPSGKTRGVGEQLARKLEKAYQRPDGWMDTPHKLSDINEPKADYETHPDELAALIDIAKKLDEEQIKRVCAMLQAFLPHKTT